MNTDTNLKLSPGAKDQLNIKYKFVRDTTPNWLLNEQKKTISNQRTSDPGLTVLDLTSKGRWGRAIDAIGSKVRKNFINDLDYLSVLEQETASQQGDLMADVSSHAAAQLAKNAAAITAGVLTGKGVPVYQSSSEVGGLGITLNEIFETEQPINVLVRDENGEALSKGWIVIWRVQCVALTRIYRLARCRGACWSRVRACLGSVRVHETGSRPKAFVELSSNTM